MNFQMLKEAIPGFAAATERHQAWRIFMKDEAEWKLTQCLPSCGDAGRKCEWLGDEPIMERRETPLLLLRLKTTNSARSHVIFTSASYSCVDALCTRE